MSRCEIGIGVLWRLSLEVSLPLGVASFRFAFSDFLILVMKWNRDRLLCYRRSSHGSFDMYGRDLRYLRLSGRVDVEVWKVFQGDFSSALYRGRRPITVSLDQLCPLDVLNWDLGSRSRKVK